MGDTHQGGPAINFKNKLKHLKGDLKKWWADTSKEKNVYKSELVKRMSQIEDIIDSGAVTQEVLNERNKIRGNYLCLIRKKC